MKDIDKQLKKYIEEKIFPIYEKNDTGHNLEHIKYVIDRSLKFSKQIKDIDYNMVYVIAAYHDLGHHIDAKNHEKISSEMLLDDENLKKYFKEEQIKIMSDAVYDHRSSLKSNPRSVYGKIVSSADRNTLLVTPLKRTYSYRICNNPDMTLEEILEESRKHIINKFGNRGYAIEKMYFEDTDYKTFLKDISKLANDKDEFRKKYFEVNDIYDLEKSMIFIFDELRNTNKDLSLDKLLYYTYIKLYTERPFYSIKNEILKLKNIDEYKYYTNDVDKDLVNYIENNVFPKYELNDKAHGLVHIKEVIRRCFALNDTYNLNLNVDIVYAISACHDINKYVDSDIHEKLASQAFYSDINMKRFFTDEEIKTIAEAIEDHRSGKEDEPRSVYGKLVSSADRNTTVEMVFIRSFFVALGNGKKSNRETIVEDYLDFTFKRLGKRYSKENPENMFFEDDIYRIFLKDMRDLLKDYEKFKNYYCKVNKITDVTKKVKDYDDINSDNKVLILK